MREIKFRAWAKYENTMMPDFQLHPDFGLLTEDQRFITMQFTGLLDKNGKEIYEGDIVKHYDERNEGTALPTTLGQGIVEYKFNLFSFGVPCVPEHLEVIGNIYENPELLVEQRHK